MHKIVKRQLQNEKETLVKNDCYDLLKILQQATVAKTEESNSC